MAVTVETWTGTDGASWPAQWTLSGPGTGTIVSNQGKLTTAATSYQGEGAYLSGAAAQTGDWDVTVDVGFANVTAEQYLTVGMGDGAFAAWGSPEPTNGYFLELFPGSSGYSLARANAGTNTSLSGDKTFTFSASTRINVRVNRTGNVLSVKLWNAGTSEPASWSYTGTDASPYNGSLKPILGFGNGYNTGQLSGTFDNFTFTPPSTAKSASGSAALAGTGTLSASGKKSVSRTAPLTGASTISASGRHGTSRLVTVAGTGALSVSARKSASSAAAVTGASATLVSGRHGTSRTASLAGGGVLAVSGRKSVSRVASVAGASVTSASGGQSTSNSVALAGTGTLSTGSGKKTVSRSVSLAGTGTLSASGRKTVSRPVSMAGAGTLSASKRKQARGSVGISASGSLATATVATTAPPTTDLPGWRHTYAEGFDTPAGYGGIWDAYSQEMRGYDAFNDTSGNGYYAPDKVLSAHDSILDFYLHTEGGQHLVAAPLPMGYAGLTYGRFSVRYRVESVPGYKIAFLQWPLSDDWADGEIDWPEANLNGFGTASPASKQLGNYSSVFAPATRVYAPTDQSGWHVATLEWTPSALTFIWDDQIVGTVTDPAFIPTKPMRWTLQAETEINGIVPDAATAGHVYVDWLSAWEYAPTSTTVGLTGSGSLAPVGKKSIARATSVSSTGSNAASGRKSVARSAALTSTGSLAASGRKGVARAATLAGTSALSPTGRKGVARTASITGASSLSASGRKTAAQSVSGTGASSLSATGLKGLSRTASIAGANGLSASGKKAGSGSAAASGTGSTGVLSGGTQGGQIHASGSGALAATGRKGAARTVSLAGGQATSVVGSRAAKAAVGVSGTAALSASGRKVGKGAVTVPGGGSLSAAGHKGSAGAATLGGAGTLGATKQQTASTTVSLGGLATLTITGRKSAAGAAAQTGTSTLAVAGMRTARRSVSIAVQSSLLASGQKQTFKSLVCRGSGDISSSATKASSGIVTLEGTSSLTAAGHAAGQADWTFHASLLPPVRSAALVPDARVAKALTSPWSSTAQAFDSWKIGELTI